MTKLIDSGIYKITCTINDKVYIGSAINLCKRKVQHFNTLATGKHDNSHLQNAYNKHGHDAFEWNVLIRCEKIQLVQYEQATIDRYRKHLGWDKMYNIAPKAGSQLGVKRSPEVRARQSARMKGLKRPLEAIEKGAAAMRGRKLSPERRAKMSATAKVIMNQPEVRAKISAGKMGHKHSPETCAKISAAHRGKKHSSEHRAKISAANKGKKMSPEARTKLSKAMMGNTNNLGHKHSAETRAKMMGNKNARRVKSNPDQTVLF